MKRIVSEPGNTASRSGASYREIAARAGVSVATVSRALSNSAPVSETLRRRVLAEAERLRPAAAGGRSVATNRIGLVYPGDPINAEYGGFDAAVMSGVNRGAFERRFDVAIVNVVEDKLASESYSEFFRRKGLDAVVLRTFTGRRHICELVAEEGFPSVVVADRFEHPKVNYVCYDSGRTSRLAVEHLLHLGHRRIALCVHTIRDSDHADRREAYTAALTAHGIPIEDEYVFEVIADVEGGASAVSRLMTLPVPPTAIVFTDPLATLGGLRRAHELEIRVPEELSIVGFDDAQMRRLVHPVYTAVCQDAEDLAYTATRWLIEHIAASPGQRLRDARSAYFEVNHTTTIAPARGVRVSPDGRRIEQASGVTG
ncbi:MAG: LacI family DNA-binding transcriptional regulator [Phycisphaerales bacterium]